MKRWFSEDSDIRQDVSIGLEILQFTKEHRVKSVVSIDRIIGCPHEEGIDYEGKVARSALIGPTATAGRAT